MSGWNGFLEHETFIGNMSVCGVRFATNKECGGGQLRFSCQGKWFDIV